MRVMFLQGHPSAFSRDLGHALMARGHVVTRVNLCFGDWLFWHGPEATSYRGSWRDWEPWIEARMRAEGTTHLVYFADRHPYHVAAQRVARRLGVICLSYEFGYLRPDWILVEEGGQSAFSQFPDDLEALRGMAAQLPQPDMRRRFGHAFWQEAVQEMAYHLGNSLFRPLYPWFRSDRVDHPVVEYLSYLPRHVSARFARGEADRIMARVLAGPEEFHLVALQMAGDYQIRANSPFRDPVDFLRVVMQSFAENGPAAGLLVVKLHPMDNGRVPWRRLTRQLATERGIGERVLFLDGGDLDGLLGRAKGCVVVNSTVGLHALQAGCPVKALGIATYDIAGITHGGDLNSFWRDPMRPDPAAVADLVKVMAAALHVRGDFFAPEGRQAAISGFVEHLEKGIPRRMGAVLPVPPRLAKARGMGLSTAPWEDADP
jgi:capsular polysaccharide export protein